MFSRFFEYFIFINFIDLQQLAHSAIITATLYSYTAS